ncbi:MAG: hypothetical protein FOGNACKC_03296 [Anaerolineae bacterium]|nr:hypothetical protein [Anaerolineae bacterium]
MNKIEFLAELHQSFDQLERAIRPLKPAQLLQPSVYDGLSVKDVLAHITAWERLSIGWVEAARRGEPVVRFAPGFEQSSEDDDDTMHRLNEHLVHLYRERPLAEVLADFTAAHQEMAALVETMSEAELTAPGRFDWWPDGGVWQVLASNSFEHYQEHLELIQNWLAGEQPA